MRHDFISSQNEAESCQSPQHVAIEIGLSFDVRGVVDAFAFAENFILVEAAQEE